jgi:hypothetical protein
METDREPLQTLWDLLELYKMQQVLREPFLQSIEKSEMKSFNPNQNVNKNQVIHLQLHYDEDQLKFCSFDQSTLSFETTQQINQRVNSNSSEMFLSTKRYRYVSMC